MLGYLVSLIYTCQSPGCSSKATKELFNDRNASLGRYCTRHAKDRLRNLNREPERWREKGVL